MILKNYPYLSNNINNLVQSNNNANDNTANINRNLSNLSKTNISNNNLYINDNVMNLLIKNNKDNLKKNLPLCRICLSDENDLENPLFSPCKCSGSMKYVHLLCIRNWYTNLNLRFKSRTSTKVCNFLIVHTFRNLDCEICKSILPEKVKIKDTTYNLMDLQRPDNNYIMLELILKEKSETRFLYIIHMKEKTTITLVNRSLIKGRANESDVRISDISVSRSHAFLKLINNKFYLEDNLSKFGSLIQIYSDIYFLPYRQISLQNGNSCLHFNLIKTFSALMCCFSKISPKTEYIDYYDYFEKMNVNNREEIMDCNINNSNVKDSQEEDDKKDDIILKQEKVIVNQEMKHLIEKESNQKDSRIQEESEKKVEKEFINENNEERLEIMNNHQKKESEFTKNFDLSRLNLSNNQANDDFLIKSERNKTQQTDRANINNYVPKESNNNFCDLPIFDENDNTMNKTFKRVLDELPNEILETQTKNRENKNLSNDNLPEILMSRFIKSSNTDLIQISDQQKDDFPDQNLVFSNLINFDVKNHEEKEDFNNLKHVFVDKIMKRIKSDNLESLQLIMKEQMISIDDLKSRKNQVLMNMSDNLCLESIDESKIDR